MLSLRSAVLGFIGLAILMVATRFPGLGSTLRVQDASWALFFIGGFYLADRWRWAFPALMVTAVAIDLVAIRYYGISNYCVTVAYGFLVPAYATLWWGGSWLRRHASLDARGLALTGVSALLSASVCFLISNGSFYWLGSRVTSPTLAGWIVNFTTWYWPFVGTCLAYVAIATLIHVLIAKLVPVGARAHIAGAPSRR